MNLLEQYIKGIQKHKKEQKYNKDLVKVIEEHIDFFIYEDWKKIKMQGTILWHNLFK